MDQGYRRHRRSVFAGIFVGYAAYYLVRNNLALAIPDILAEYPQHSKADLGWALTGLSISYGISKFLMGSVSDRANPKYFLPLGLLLSCAIMFASGTVKAIYASLRVSNRVQLVLMFSVPAQKTVAEPQPQRSQRLASVIPPAAMSA